MTPSSNIWGVSINRVGWGAQAGVKWLAFYLESYEMSALASSPYSQSGIPPFGHPTSSYGPTEGSRIKRGHEDCECVPFCRANWWEKWMDNKKSCWHNTYHHSCCHHHRSVHSPGTAGQKSNVFFHLTATVISSEEPNKLMSLSVFINWSLEANASWTRWFSLHDRYLSIIVIRKSQNTSGVIAKKSTEENWWESTTQGWLCLIKSLGNNSCNAANRSQLKSGVTNEWLLNHRETSRCHSLWVSGKRRPVTPHPRALPYLF